MPRGTRRRRHERAKGEEEGKSNFGVAVESMRESGDVFDECHDDGDKILLDDKEGNEGSDLESEEENVLALDGVGSSEEEDDFSDSEEDSSDENDEYGESEGDTNAAAADTLAWGSKASTFYNTDYVDDELGSGSEDELAAMEEEEAALVVQRRLRADMAERDFGEDVEILPAESEDDLEEEDGGPSFDLVKRDLSKLSKQEKLQLVMKECPELIPLHSDLLTKMVEADETSTLLDSLRAVSNPDKRTVQMCNFVELKLQLYLSYCVHILFYLTLKLGGKPTKNHPVMSRLVELQTMLRRCDKLDGLYEGQLTDFKQGQVCGSRGLSTKLSGQPSMNPFVNDRQPVCQQQLPVVQKRKRKRAHENGTLQGVSAPEPVANHTTANKLRVEQTRLPDEEDTGPRKKRAITYEIKKNKGLTPHRKKEQRNPRVKHRKKFHKAKIRRKGQVREVRTAYAPYSGEETGIRSHVTKSVRIS